MKAAAIQHDIVWEDPKANFKRLTPLLAEAAEGGAELLVMTEMFSTGFSMDTTKVAEPPDGPSAEFLLEQAQKLDTWVCGSFPEMTSSHALPYNQLMLAGPAGETHRYGKIHPFSYSGEDNRYAAGTDTLNVKIGDIRLSAFICYDLRFANSFWSLADETDLYIVIANWPKVRCEHWKALLKARAIENQAFVLGANRVGRDGNKIDYSGDSMIINPLGEVLAQNKADEEKEVVLVADIDPGTVSKTREKYPFLRDRTDI